MFNWIDMIGTHEERMVDNYKDELFEIDTSYVTDRTPPFETAIKHSQFRNGEWIVLGWRVTKTDAQKFHDEMVKYYKENGDKVDYIQDVWENVTYMRED